MSLSSPTPTSSSTSLSKPGGTATNVLALTTPFVQKPDCESIWALSHVASYEDDGHLTSEAFLASDADDERFTSCQPPGWASVVPASRFSFSPAVCPSNWTYYDMASTTNAGTTFTTAYCCAGCVLCATLLVFIIGRCNTSCSLFDEALLTLTAASSIQGLIT